MECVTFFSSASVLQNMLKSGCLVSSANGEKKKVSQEQACLSHPAQTKLLTLDKLDKR